MKNKQLVSLIMAAASLVLGLISLLILPKDVVIQFTMDGSFSTAPRMLAALIPTALGVGGAIAASRTDERHKERKSIIVSGLGILLLIVMLAVNLIIL